MALNKDSLETKIKNLLSLDDEPQAADEDDCANKISDYIDEYLADVEVGVFAAPGIIPGSPPDPGPPPGPKVLPAAPLLAPGFRAALIAAMTGQSGDFTPCGPGYAADMALMVAVTDDVYNEAGVSACVTPPDINAPFDKGNDGEDHAAVAKELATQIHNATTATTYTGAAPYTDNVAAVAPAPHSSPFS